MDAIYITLRESPDEIAAITGCRQLYKCLASNLTVHGAYAAEAWRWSLYRTKRLVEEPATMTA